jgi:hypothetical protein
MIAPSIEGELMYDHGMIAPVVALVIWTMIMLIWLYATRIPAMQKAKVRPGEATKAQMEALPSANVASNYNHLHEQPTLFYTICFALQFLDQAHETNIGLAWLYVVLRIVHSLIQATVNIIMIRWLVFMAASIVLGVLTVQAAIGVGMVDVSFLG